MTDVMHNQERIFNLQETTTDEALVPTRGGDWDDGGVFRVLHAHTWTPIHVHFKGTFNQLGGMQHAATTVLAFGPNEQQRAEALFIRSLAQFYTLDMFGQVPYRSASNYNSIDPALVLSPAEAVDTLVTVLDQLIQPGVLPDANAPYKASPDAAKFLLMKVLLNKGAFLNKAAPSFDNADMQRVIDLGESIINSGNYSLNPNYFDNFGPSNATTSTESILAWNNTGAATSGEGLNSGGINGRWMMTLHYNSWNAKKGSAGWNGFATLSDFYSTFAAGDKRVGQVAYPGVTDVSGLRPGFLVGQQVDETGANLQDRQGNPLAFTPEVGLIETQKERIEVAGIRVIKYPPDYSAYDGGNQKNQLQIFRYADVVLMVAEAYARMGNTATALTMVNDLRAIRGADPLTSLTLVNPADVDDPATLLAERGRELYWESWRRQDLIRFGVFGIAWELKDADEDPARNLLFPIAPDELLANPNLVQNAGY
ncbi:MAG: RagB/SusD family nutrient uptake outer membrane protein [Sphingobacteriales bacterium]|nr:MAG: RagB/SusD family nutrient uptake outer membrane protein [Sphingobacteriales bacterium]